jgi:hypothetical protein
MKPPKNINDPSLRAHLIEPEFALPDDYFATLTAQIIAKISPLSEEAPPTLDQQNKQLLALAHITSIDNGHLKQWKVPEGYFEKMHGQIEQHLDFQAHAPTKIIRMKPLWWTTLAASIAILIAFFVLYPDRNQLSFENLLAEYELKDEDIEWLTESDELALIYLDESGLQDFDTLIRDSLNLKPQKLDSQSVAGSVHQPLTTKVPKKVSWDDITEDEIWEYLMDTGNAEELLDN